MNGPAYEADYDQARLSRQYQRIFALMLDQEWRTLDEIAQILGDPEASISAQLRHMRKKRNGSHTVNRRNRGDRMHGHYEYQLIPNSEACDDAEGCAAGPARDDMVPIS